MASEKRRGGILPLSLPKGPGSADAWTPTLPPPGRARRGSLTHAIFRRFQSSFKPLLLQPHHRLLILVIRLTTSSTLGSSSRAFCLVDHGLTVKTKCDEFQRPGQGEQDAGPSGDDSVPAAAAGSSSRAQGRDGPLLIPPSKGTAA